MASQAAQNSEVFKTQDPAPTVGQGPPYHYILAIPMAFLRMTRYVQFKWESTDKRGLQGSVLLHSSHLRGILECHE